MQTSKDYIKKDLLRTAGDLFYEKGFLGVSMRDISGRAGVGLSNIYNYFSSKDDIFRKTVSPVMAELEAMLDEHHGHKSHDIKDMCEEAYFHYVVRQYTLFINRNRRLLTILLLRAQGSSLERYREDFTSHAAGVVKEYFADMKRRHPDIRADISEVSIRMHTIWMFAMFEELLTCKVKPDKIEKIITEYMTIEVSGWRELMKI